MVLASSLLGLEIERDRAAAEAGGRIFTTGIVPLDKELPADIWTGGTVVGIGRIDADATKSLSLEITATHLLEEAHRTTTAEKANDVDGPLKPKTSVFIVTPPNQATTAIRSIYQLLVNKISQARPQPLTTGPRTASHPTNPLLSETKSLLGGVSLLQYLDMSGLSESLSEVFTVLSGSAEPASAGSNSRNQKTILLVQGITHCTTTMQRRSGALQTTALVSSVLRAIRNIVRARGGLCLGLVEFDVSWSNTAADVNTPTPGPHLARHVNIPPGATSNASVTGLETAFASKTGKVLRINSLSASLSRILEEGVDVMVAVHDADGKVDATKTIVEVVRDERAAHSGEESALASWAVWN